MIGSGLKKLAKEYGMGVSNGVAYGSLRGFAATFSEGAGYKRVVISTMISDPVKQTTLQQRFAGRNLLKEYRVQSLDFTPKFIQVDFQDNPGTMKLLRAFLEELLPALEESGATGAEICSECGMPVAQGGWTLVNGTAFRLHEACAQRLSRQVQAEREAQELETKESYLTGALGALLGAMLGAVLWAVVLKLGYVASIVGFVIAFLAVTGYDLCRGKQGKGKLWILLLSVAVGVALGNLGAYVWELAGMISSGELIGWDYSEIPVLLKLLFADSEFAGDATTDMLLGLVYAALGAWGIVFKTKKQVEDFRMVELP